jgi:1-acyl-sn-glycerol-3-phosphate acyltransferase
MNLFFRLAVCCLKGYFRLFYRVRVYGRENIPQGRAIIAPNHASFLDPPLLGAIWPEEIHFLARASLFNSTPLKFLLSCLNTHPVQGSVQDLNSLKLICQLLNSDQKIVIFPEGVRSDTGQLQSVKAGVMMLALRTKSPLIPVYLHGTFEAWPRQKRWPTAGHPLTIVIGQPIDIEPYCHLGKKEGQRLLAEKLQASLETLRQRALYHSKN